MRWLDHIAGQMGKLSEAEAHRIMREQEERREIMLRHIEQHGWLEPELAAGYVPAWAGALVVAGWVAVAIWALWIH